MRHLRPVVGMILGLGLAVGCLNPESLLAKETLRWKFRTGQKFDVHLVRSNDSVINADAAERSENDEFVADELCSVESVDAHGTAHITMTVERVRLKRRSPKTKVDIDTTERTEKLPTDIAVLAELMKKIIRNLKVRFTVDSRGRVLTVEVNEQTIKEWASVIPGWSDQLSEKGIMQTLKQTLPVLPEASLTLGDTWNDILELNRPHATGFQRVHVTYRYAGPTKYKNGTVEKILTQAELDWGGDKSPQGVAVKVVSQENPGVIYFDNRAGRLLEMEEG
jgi:hypothetical protein